MTADLRSPVLPPLRLQVDVERLVFREPFRVTGYEFREIPIVVVTLTDGHLTGRGEAAGVYYTGDNVGKMLADIGHVEKLVSSGISRATLALNLGPGGARNALDCALWDIEAQMSSVPVWERAGLARPRPVRTVQTLGAEDPEAMAGRARQTRWARAFKLKLLGDVKDAQRVAAVREARPEVWLGVDANQGFTPGSLSALMPSLIEADVRLIEQPFERGADELLRDLKSPIPIAADESLLDCADLAKLAGLYQVANIKLDKCGGLTEALAMASTARDLGLAPMVGNMTGTSLAMAPAFLLAQLCDYIDLDGPTFITQDRQPAMIYEAGTVACPKGLWGLT